MITQQEDLRSSGVFQIRAGTPFVEER